MPTITVDIDSTLADTTHRQHLINTEHRDETDWTAYAKACAHDQPTDVVTLVDLLGVDHDIVLVTSRPEAARPETVAWLDLHKIVYDDLVMAPDTTDPTGFKVEAIRKINSEYPVALHLDDWWGVGQAVRDELGIPVVIVRVYPPEREMTR